jgi:hypothetical protein
MLRTRKVSSQDETISFDTKGVEKTESKFKFHAGKTISFDTKGVEKTESISCISCTLLYLSSSEFVFLLKCPTTPLVSSLRKAKQSMAFIRRIKFAAAYQKNYVAGHNYFV